MIRIIKYITQMIKLNYLLSYHINNLIKNLLLKVPALFLYVTALTIILVILSNLFHYNWQLYLYKEEIGLIIQLVLAAGAIWLAFETYMLKLRTEGQIKISKLQTETEKKTNNACCNALFNGYPCKNC